MEVKENTLRQACNRLVVGCAALQHGDRALIISNPETFHLGESIAAAAGELGARVCHSQIPQFTMHGQEPSSEVADLMLESDAIFAVTRFSMAHSKARFSATAIGARYLSLPDYSEKILMGRAMQADFKGLTALSRSLAEMLSKGDEIRITTARGTNLVCAIHGRKGNAAPGWCYGRGTIASPPDAETNIALLEDGSEGEVIVDGSIPCPEIGLLSEPIRLRIKDGRVTEISGGRSKELEKRYDLLGNPRTRIVAELGIGLNPLATLSGAMLEDEGCLGTVHLGMGSNATIGGQNEVPFHLDHVIRDVSLEIDGKPIDVNSVL